MMSSIVVVCTGNICRSPVGESALQALLPGAAYKVTSVGTHAMIGRPAEPEARSFLDRELGVEIDHRAEQLTQDVAESADLILTMTEDHRSWVAGNAPRAVRRTFTLRELAQIIDLLPADGEYVGLRDMALAASRLRTRLRTADSLINIADPYRGPPEAYERSFAAVLKSSRQIAQLITTRVASHGSGD